MNERQLQLIMQIVREQLSDYLAEAMVDIIAEGIEEGISDGEDFTNKEDGTMAGYNMKELATDMDILIRELRGLRKEMITMRRLIQKQQRLQFPMISVEPEEEEEEE